MKKVLIAVVSVFLAFAYLVYKQSEPKEKRPIKIPIPKETLTTDPHKYEDLYSMFLIRQIYTSLFQYDADGNIQPALVDKWHYSAEAGGYLFQIKSRHFSSGEKITAEHVKCSLLRIFSEDASIAADMQYLVGVDEYRTNEILGQIKIDAVADDQIFIATKKKADIIITHLATPDTSVLNCKMANNAITLNSDYSGDYRLDYLEATKQYQLTKNQVSLHPNAPYVLLISYLTQANLAKAILDNEFDTYDLYEVNKEDHVRLESLGWRQVLSNISNEFYLLTNPDSVSKIIRMCIATLDQTELIRDLGFDWAQPLFGILPNTLSERLISKQEVQGVCKWASLESEVQITYNSESSTSAKIFEWLQTKLAKYNIKLIAKPVRIDEFFSILSSKKSSAIIFSKGIDYPDAYANLAYFSSKSASNYFFLESNQLDTQIDELVFLSGEARKEIVTKIQTKIIGQNTVFPLFSGSTASGLWGPVFEFVPGHPLGIQFLSLSDLRVQNENL